MLSSEKMQWFAMRATYRRGMQIKALLDKEGQRNNLRDFIFKHII